MPEIDPVVLRLLVDDREYRAHMKRTTRTVEDELGRQEARARRLEQEMRRSSSSIGASLKGLAGTIATAFSARQIVGLLDSFTRYENALKVAGLEGQNLARVQQQLFEVAQRNGVQLEAVGTLYGRAAQSAQSLGASQADLIKFTEAVSASLRSTGTSTEQAQGALLQLGQALGSPRVQAEEFNSIIDTMRPLLVEASKYIDGTGGSLDGLIRKLKDTKGPGVSNIELFRGIVAALDDIEEKASRASQTISQGFTALTNALTKYAGEADRSNGASKALAAGLQAMAENLDTIIPALAIVATALGGRLVAGALGGATALTTVGAYASIATTSLAGTALAARSAGAALITALGGPVGAAITAVVVGLGAVAANADFAEQRIGKLKDRVEEGEREAREMARKLDEAGVATDSLGRFAVDASGKVAGLSAQMSEAARRAAELTAKMRDLGIYTDLQNNLGRQNEIVQELKANRNAGREASRRAGNPFLAQTRTGDAASLRSGRNEQLERELALLRREQEGLEARAEGVRLAFNNGVDLSGASPPATSIPPAAKPTSAGRKVDPAAEARREAQARAAYANELDQLQADELAARAELTGAVEDKLKADLARLDADARSFARQVALDEGLDDAQRQKLIAERAEVTALDRRARIRDAEIAEIERRTRILAEQNQSEGSYLQSQLRLIDDREERARVEHAILDLQYETEKAELRANIAALKLAGAKEEEVRLAEQRLALLEKQHAVDGKVIDQDNRSPLQRYFDDLDKTETELRDDAERVVIQEIEYVRRGMRDAISDALGVDDPLLGGLIDLLIEQLVLKPLAKSLAAASEAGGGGGFIGTAISTIGSFFGGARATGGPVSAGKAYVVGERGPEIIVPGASGTVIPNHAIQTLANSPLRGGAGSSGGVATVRLELSGDIDAKIVEKSSQVVVEFERSVGEQRMRNTAAFTIDQAQRPRM